MLKFIKSIIYVIVVLVGVPVTFFVVFLAWEWLDWGGVRKAARIDPRSQSEILREFVLYEGVTLKAILGDETLRISASKLLQRSYFWHTCELGAELNPRRSRWYGSMGGYNAGASFGLSAGGCNGISRPVVGEGQIHFDNHETAEKWIKRQPDFFKKVWNTDGLLVTWATIPERSQLNVDVWQMCLNGKPYTPAGVSKNSTLSVTPNNEGLSLRPCVAVDQVEIDKTKAHWDEHWRMSDKVIELRKNNLQ
jgi:hypothetical protein